MRHSDTDSSHFDFFDHKIKNFVNNSSLDENVVICGQKISITPVFYSYWMFAAERQRIFFRRYNKSNGLVYTADPILAQYKFTNTYRASDRVSQYLIRNVIYRKDLPHDEREVFFRILLFKLFNKIETWEALEKAVGPIRLSTYDFRSYDAVLSEIMSNGGRIYSAAYIMPSCGKLFGYKYKHQNHFKLLEYMIDQRIPEKFSAATTMSDAYQLLLSVPSIGPFLAYQYVTDLNYSQITDFSEAEFVVAGPGALDGIRKCFAGLGKIPASEVIRFMMNNQRFYFSQLSLDFQSLWGRPLQLVDCQNIFCEISKYARVAFPDIRGISDRKRIKQKFTARSDLPIPWYPPKWNINSKNSPVDQFSESPGSEIASAVQPTML